MRFTIVCEERTRNSSGVYSHRSQGTDLFIDYKIVNNFSGLGLKMSKPWCYFIQRDVRNDFSMAVSLSEATGNKERTDEK